MMFDMVPFGKRSEETFNQLVKSFGDVFSNDFFAPFKGSALSFKTDIRETENAYLVEAELPGFHKDDIEIRYENPYLTIKAVRKEDNNMEDADHNIVRRERSYGQYVRRFYVQHIDEDGIRASLKNGVLKLEIPKQPDTRTKRIQIRDDV